MPKKAMSSAKYQIFEKAVEMFAEKSYETVSIHAIADALGRRPSGIYNHFASKQDILDTLYVFFEEHFTLDRPTLKQLEPIIKRGSIEDILMSVNYDFAIEYRKILLDIYRIVQQRKYFDKKAHYIAKITILQGGFEFVKAVLDKAVAMERLAPFDTASMATFCNNNRTCFYTYWVLDPTMENVVFLENQMRVLNGHAIKLITDLGKLE